MYTHNSVSGLGMEVDEGSTRESAERSEPLLKLCTRTCNSENSYDLFIFPSFCVCKKKKWIMVIMNEKYLLCCMYVCKYQKTKKEKKSESC